ncbi:MAG: hypothetical protein KC994_08600 [Candidatus Omnitrophica bacterium]|nr:hypothetical protein [Candidatus Omnitrophota bacterium]
MMKDPILEEIYEARRQILEECDHNVERLIARLESADYEGTGERVTPEDVRKLSDRPKTAPSELL